MQDLNILSVLTGTALLSSLPEDVLLSVAAKVEIIDLKLGENVLKKGEAGTGYFIVLKGKVRVIDDLENGKPVTLAVLTDGEGFGERSLFFDEPSSATVRSAGKTVLLKLSRDSFKALAEQFPEFIKKIEQARDRQDEFNFLKTQQLISGLSPQKTELLISKITRIEKKPNELIFDEGQSQSAIFIVRNGDVQLTKPSANNRLLGIRREGDVIGEMFLLNEEPSLERASAGDTGCIILCLDVNDFKEIIGDSEAVNEAINDYARRQLLQRKVMLAENNVEKQSWDPKSYFERGKIKLGGLFGSSYPLSVVNDPNLSGIACIDMAARYFNKEVTSDELAEQQYLSPSIEDLHSVGRKAESQGLMSRLVTLSSENLNTLALPAVYEDPEYGPCLIYSIGAKKIVVANPLHGIKDLTIEQFTKRWNGEALTLTVAPDFGAVGDNAAGLLKQFLPLLKPHRGIITRIILITILVQLAGVLPPFFTQILIDNVLVVGDQDLLVLLLVGLVIATFLVTVADSVRDFLTIHLTRRITATLFTRFFDHILSLPSQVLSKWDTGSLTARFEENETVLNTMSSGAMTIIMNSFSVLIYTPILLAMNPQLACITIFFCICICAITLLSAKKIRRYEQMEFDLGAEQESHLIEVVKGIDTVKALAQEDEFIERGNNYFSRSMKLTYEKERFDQRLEFATEFLEASANISVLAVGAWFVVNGKMTPGQLIAFSSLSAMVTNPIEELAGFYDEWLEFKVALQRINDILSSKREQNDGVAICPPLSGSIKFENVSFSYDPDNSQNIINDLNLEIQAGQKVAFVGRSGSGKSTLVNMVNRILSPTSGRVLIDGVDVSTLDLVSLRQQIGVVEQSPFVFSGTVRENITIVNPSTPYEAVVSAATLAGVHDFASNLPMRYDTRIGEGGRALSGGQQQRLIIARALAADPKILILDEATSALDNESEKIIQKNLDKVMEGRTTLAIAHRLSTIRNADMIIVLENGEVAEKGNHDELMKSRGFYHYLVTKSNEG